MPLITCPQCGQSVSDSAKTCIHCGCELKKESENFYDLPYDKQENLLKEYCLSGVKLPQYCTVIEIHSAFIYKFLMYIGLIACFILTLIFTIIGAFYVDILFLTISAVNLCIIGILAFLLTKTIKKYKHAIDKMIETRVDFEKWLNDIHNITITWEWGSSAKYYLEYKQLKQKRGMN